jgi:tetratricopeptide (TPR) repeat protein
MSEKNGKDATYMEQFGAAFQKIRQNIEAECPEAEDLQLYLAAKLSGKKRRALARHLDLCPVCFEVFQRLKEAEESSHDTEIAAAWRQAEKDLDARIYPWLQQTATQHPGLAKRIWLTVRAAFSFVTQPLRWKPPMVRRAAYAGIMLAGLLAIVYGYAFFSRPPYLALARIEPEKLGAIRSAGIETDVLREGLQLLDSGHYSEAIQKLQIYLNTHPDHFQASFSLGIAYLLDARQQLPGLLYGFSSEKVKNGITWLNRAMEQAGENDFYLEDCLWYLGKAYLMLNEPQRARSYFAKILEIRRPNLMRKAAAREMLARLNAMARL